MQAHRKTNQPYPDGMESAGTIAIVNDDPIQLAVQEGLVEKMGLQPVCFRGAEEALEGMRQDAPPLLVVTDLYMPELDGWRFCRLLRSAEFSAFNRIPILVVSATFAGEEPERIAADLGAEAFLPCPLDGETFLATIQDILAGHAILHCPHVLILEDDASFSKLVAQGFTQQGYRVTTAETCREAAEVLHTEHVDVAVLDVHLPDGNGSEILRTFHSDTDNTVFIMMTGEPNPDAYLSWMKSGASASFPKPFDIGYLLEVCARARREQWLLRVEHLLEVRTRELQEREKEREKLQAQLLQSQKMETVGRLAGGVAHDFNNMLGVILGNTELAMDFVESADPLFENLKEVRNAAVRSADITRQLLAFSRKQAVAPVTVDLNAQVEGMLKMLRRLLTEDVSMRWRPGRDVWPIRIDPCQVDQVLANLCVNARDAIKELPGVVTIKTENVTLDQRYCAEHPDCTPGHYVCLRIRDNGVGMDNEVLAHAFEPFFTTKEVGQGTGLGLATVFGIVKQNDGTIAIESTVGEGTEFQIYLPRDMEAAFDATETEEVLPVSCGHGETVLIVEDEPAILQLSCMLLEQQRYRVLAASGPSDALRLAREHDTTIDLLLTDVIMPEMNGAALEGEIRHLYPNIKCLFMSGYTADVIDKQGVREAGWHFIQKPFSGRELARQVLEILEADSAAVVGRDAPSRWDDTTETPEGSDDTEEHVVAKSPEWHQGSSEATGQKVVHFQLSQQLQRQHKMESIGRLARGVAHDCNNLIMVIQWYTEQALELMEASHPSRQWLGKIMSAAGESAALTREMLARQMLEFARNQSVQPEVVDLSVVEGMLKLMERFWGKTLTVRLLLGDALWQIYMDPAQLDQLVFHLCLNAQVALGADEGDITVEIQNDASGALLSAHRPDFVAGDYVRIRVRDTGCGMEEKTLAQVFDPFYTTKPEAAGLGLTTVFGIVKQNNGYVFAASEVGKGTVMDLYLPRYIAGVDGLRSDIP